jgi:hypothetical protein
MSIEKKESKHASLSQSIETARPVFDRSLEINQMNTLNPEI